mmetsp:Transcript_69902/g.167799  ORF Transcript_69902/g.167799 Transcript_69902/m.167799 type:complete len:235 (-) Transcript_69902:293-997(-)
MSVMLAPEVPAFIRSTLTELEHDDALDSEAQDTNQNCFSYGMDKFSDHDIFKTSLIDAKLASSTFGKSCYDDGGFGDLEPARIDLDSESRSGDVWTYRPGEVLVKSQEWCPPISQCIEPVSKFLENNNELTMEGSVFDDEQLLSGLSPFVGTEDLPTMGSAGHYFGTCKPCAFAKTKGCKDGVACRFCHLCGAGEKQRRKKERRAAVAAERRMQQTRRWTNSHGGAPDWAYGSY